LPGYHRIYIDVLLALDDGDLERAYRSGRELRILLPGNPAAKIWQAYLCVATNRPREALAVLEGIDSLVGDSPARMWWVNRRRREAFFRLGAYEDALRASREMRDLSSDPVLGWSDELVILAAAGRLDQLEVEVGRYLAEVPAEIGVGRRLANVGLALRLFGEESTGADLLHRAVAWWETQPPRVTNVGRQRYLQMETLYAAQQWEEALSHLQGLLAERPEDLEGLGYLGLIAARQGNRVRADSVVALLEARGSAGNEVLPTYYRARIAAVLGEQVEAVQLLRRAIDAGYLFFGSPFDQFTRWDFVPLSEYRPYQDLSEPKG
jgi:tetratricopeptide (TPR) repeat protein